MMNKLIELKNLTKNFDDQQVLRGINLDIYEKEFLTLLGPSGCGKTTTLRIIAGFEEPSDGEVLFNGIEISKLPPYKREVNTVFQKYALFPHLNVAENIGFGLNLKKVDKTVIAQKVERMLKMVGLEGFGKRDVTLLSGGQQQRVMIAMALACEPKLLIADEPTTALDVTIQEQILHLIKELNEKLGMSVLFITHDMGAVAQLCHSVKVMYLGQVVEDTTTEELFANPLHPYTEGLLACIPHLGVQRGKELPTIPGTVPPLTKIPVGCHFCTRCKYADDRCKNTQPPLVEAGKGHLVKCWKYADQAVKEEV